jgi:DNA-binding XRE family transcriptional regulator
LTDYSLHVIFFRMSKILQNPSKAAKNPNTVETFQKVIAFLCPKASIRVEEGGEKAGNVWFDIEENGIQVTAEWRPGLGIGIYHPDAKAYGTSPQEVFPDVAMAGRRVRQLLGARNPKPLRMIRDLLELSQEEVAGKLQVKQAAISRLEARKDPKLQSLINAVRAMGGNIEVRARFKGGEFPILMSPEREQNQPARRRREAVHA